MLKRLWLVLIVLSAALPVLAQQFKTPQELADPDGRFADVNGASIYYIARGNPDDPAVILIHGFGGSTFTWRDNMDALAAAGLYVVALDLPPFGLSDKSPTLDYTRAGMAETVVGLMDVLAIERASIVGHSMGGGVTACVAVRHPERVERLVFVAGGVFDPALREPAETETTTEDSEQQSPLALLRTFDPNSPLAATLLRTLLTPERFTDILTSAYYRPEIVTDEVAAGYQRPLAIETWTAGFLAYQRAEDANPVTLAQLAQMDVPTLILWGEEDTWVPITVGEAMAAMLPSVTFITYPATGHLPMEEDTAAFNADVIAFLTPPAD
ncbi:MAG: alpha/beta hydrolase [Anaerolineae bacterium]|nr:alpha/beta hydrolase [Anaerolineae bacterium]